MRNESYDKDGILLDIQNLHVGFATENGYMPVVTGVDMRIDKGDSVALVGESGCGKSITALSIMRLLDLPGCNGADKLEFDGKELQLMTDSQMQDIRGDRASKIFQDPMTALNPVFTIGDQIAEVYRIHRKMKEDEAEKAACEMLAKVGIPEPIRRSKEYPHQLSGGMRQRVLIAMAVALKPALLIADEPTTALDVTIQAQVLELIDRIQKEMGMALLLVMHDLAVVAEVAKRVMVMYCGEIVEEAPVEELYEKPLHPYTSGLMRAMPDLKVGRGERLYQIPGTVPHPTQRASGCRFYPRCDQAFEECKHVHPELTYMGGRTVRCLKYGGKEGA